MKKALLGIDIGTTSTKAVLFDQHGAELARGASSSYRQNTPHPSWVEQDPEVLWQAVLLVLKQAMSEADVDIQVKALCIAAQSGSLLPADQDGNPVYPLITWMDGRTQELVTRWRASDIQAEVRETSGWSLYPGLCLPTIAWLRQHDPETFAAARHYFSVNDFITHRLTGKFVTNPSNGGGMQLVDIHTGQWSESLAALAGITTDQLSGIQPSGTVIGEILPQVCAATGLTPGAVLVNGGHDQGCTALGLGIIEPGKLLLACGTAWVFTAVVKTVDLAHIPSTLDLNFHAVPNRWVISQSLGGLGASLEWWLHQAWGSPDGPAARQEKFCLLNDALNTTRPNDGLIFIPLTGGHDDPSTTHSGGFVGLRLDHNRADMARAIMESAGFELRWALETMKNTGIPVEELYMVGGAAHSSLWPTILANITGLPLHLPRYDNWPALGAALLAGFGTGLFGNLSDALSGNKKPIRAISPEPLLVETYDRCFRKYKAFSDAMLNQSRM